MMDTRTITVSDGRAKIQVLESGHGPDLVFFHGAGGATQADPFLDALSRRFRVRAPLLPGYGESEGGDNFRTMLDITLLGLDMWTRSRSTTRSWSATRWAACWSPKWRRPRRTTSSAWR